jgi:hypothetical protein
METGVFCRPSLEGTEVVIVRIGGRQVAMSVVVADHAPSFISALDSWLDILHLQERALVGNDPQSDPPLAVAS